MMIRVILLIFFLSSPALLAQGAARSHQQVLDDEETGGRGKFHSLNTPAPTDENGEAQAAPQNQMDMISEQFSEVKQAYTQCSLLKEEGKLEDEDTVEDCIWRDPGVAAIQNDIISFLDDEKKKHNDSPDIKTGEQGTFRTTKNQANRKLEDYLKQRLTNILYDKDNKDGLKILSDHGEFYQIYKSQIGQNVIRVISDTCMYANEDGSLRSSLTKDKDKLKENKERNMKNLSEPDPQKNQPKAYTMFENCIRKIPKACKDGNKPACKVLKYMEEAKKGIQDIDGVSQELADYHKDSVNKKFARVKSSEKQNSEERAKATLIASGEIGDAEISEVAEEESQLLEECEQTMGQSNSDCNLYLTDTEVKEEIEVEFMIREKAKEERLKKSLDEAKASGDTDALREILKEEGMTDEQIDRYLAKKETDPNFDPYDDIRERYENKRKAVIEELSNRITEKQSPANIAAGSGTNPFQDLKERSDSRVTDLETSIHFANVVGSFISIGDEGMKNTNALANELDNSSFQDLSNRADLNYIASDHFNSLSQSLDQAENKGPEDSLPMFEANDIHTIIYGLGDGQGAQTP